MTRRAMINQQMSRVDPDQVHLMVVEFPAGTPPFNVEMAAELMRLNDVGLIRVLDLLVVLKDDDGHVRRCEARSLDGLDVRRLERDLPRVLAADDVSRLAAALKPGTAAGVVVWGDTWLAPLVHAAGRAGDIAAGAQPGPESTSVSKIGTDEEWGRGTWEPLSPTRRRPGIVREPVARVEGVQHRYGEVLDRGPAAWSSSPEESPKDDGYPTDDGGGGSRS